MYGVGWDGMEITCCTCLHHIRCFLCDVICILALFGSWWRVRKRTISRWTRGAVIGACR